MRPDRTPKGKRRASPAQSFKSDEISYGALRRTSHEFAHFKRADATAPVPELNRAGQHSIRINDQYRVCFEWTDAGPVDVEIVDYH